MKEFRMKYKMCKVTVKVMVIVFFLFNAQAVDWVTNYKKAASDAKSSGKNMLLDFCGSDWCGWCIKLEKEVFSTNEFTRYADKNLICVQVDFPNNKPQSDELKTQNAELAEKYNIEGYPTVILLNPEGKLIAKTGYQDGGTKKYIEHLEALIKKADE